jgi:hypothetical protein
VQSAKRVSQRDGARIGLRRDLRGVRRRRKLGNEDNILRASQGPLRRKCRLVGNRGGGSLAGLQGVTQGRLAGLWRRRRGARR